MVVIHLRAACGKEQGGTVCSGSAEMGTHRVTVIPSQGPVAARALRGGQAGRRDKNQTQTLGEE